MQKMTPVWDLLKDSFSAYQAKFKILTKLAVFNLIPFAISLVVGGLTAGWLVIARVNFEHGPFPVGLFLFALLLGLGVFLVSIIIGLGVFAGIFYAIKEGSNESNAVELFKRGWANIGSMAWIAFLAGIIFLGGLILFVVPGIIFAVWFSQSLYIYVFEGTKGSAALKKSKEMVKGYFWPVLGRFLVLGVLSFLVSLVRLLGPLINVLFLNPFGTVYGYRVYQDLKRVKSS